MWCEEFFVEIREFGAFSALFHSEPGKRCKLMPSSQKSASTQLLFQSFDAHKKFEVLMIHWYFDPFPFVSETQKHLGNLHLNHRCSCFCRYPVCWFWWWRQRNTAVAFPSFPPVVFSTFYSSHLHVLHQIRWWYRWRRWQRWTCRWPWQYSFMFHTNDSWWT